MKLSTKDFLFLQFKTRMIRLTDIGAEYYPHLSLRNLRDKANRQEFPFACFQLDKSNKAPYFVDIDDLAAALEDAHKQTARDWKNLQM